MTQKTRLGIVYRKLQVTFLNDQKEVTCPLTAQGFMESLLNAWF